MPRHDNDEPQRRRQQDGENRPQRPTQDRPEMPRFNPGQQGPDYLPAGPNDQPPQRGREQGPNRAPELNRATGDETRRSAQGITNPDMRDMLNRLRRIDQPGDMSDAEARRIAGLDQENGDPRPTDANIVPAVTRHEVARISQDIQAAGQVYPKWHGIKHLPGFQDSRIRGMGGDLFSAFTTTPHHDILTISTKSNPEREVNAVAAWLFQNGDNLGPVHIDYSGYGMPGYDPEVTEFRTENTRFHVVRDREGQYIYAYPEGTAVQHGAGTPQLGNDSDESDFGDDEEDYGSNRNKQKRLKEGTQMNAISVSEQIRQLTNKLNQLEESAVIDDLLAEAIEDAILEASTLSKLVGSAPGGAQLVKALHARHKLAAGPKTRSGGPQAGQPTAPQRPNSQNIDPVYEPVNIKDVKNIARTIKASKDNFAILVGTHGVAGVKPEEQHWDQSRSKELDNKMPYVVVWTTGDGVDQEIAKYRMGRTDATGGAEGTTGTPNLLNVLRDRIGDTVALYRATGAVERGLAKTRAGYKAGPSDVSNETIAKKIQPVIQRIVQQTLGQLAPRINQLSRSGAGFDQVQKLAQAGQKLQTLATAMDATNVNWEPGTWGSPMRTYYGAVDRSIRAMSQGKSAEEVAQMKQNIMSARGAELGELLAYVRDFLFKANEL